MTQNISWLAHLYQPTALIDIGANDGAYGAYLQKLFKIERVDAFEPLPQYQSVLKERGFEVHPIALSDTKGEAAFFVNSYDSASSLLPTTEICRAEYPQTGSTVSRRVKTARLDDELPDAPDNSLIKIDAQGYELPIIRGGQSTFSRAAVVLIEVSFQELYLGQALFNKVHAALDTLGFELAGMVNQHVQKETGRPLFAHCCYTRRNERT